MTTSDLWDADAADRYDEAVADMFAPDVLTPTVDLLADLAREGRALEFAIGTGRVAIPLAERGVDVSARHEAAETSCCSNEFVSAIRVISPA